MAKKFYAVRNGRVPGVYMTWADCEKQVKGFGGAIYKSFPTEAEARAFVEDSGLSLSDFMSANKSEPKSSKDGKSKSISSSSRAQNKVSTSVVKVYAHTVFYRVIKCCVLLSKRIITFPTLCSPHFNAHIVIIK